MRKTQDKKRTSFTTVLLIVIFFIGISVLLYPSISNYFNQINASHVVLDYDAALQEVDNTELQRMLKSARDYNDRLSVSTSMTFRNGEAKGEEYKSLLSLNGSGVMGYVTIKKIGVQIPIYHGTSEDVLQIAAGHLEGSSLPVGGSSTHAVISAHRGLPSAKLFTDLDQLEVGDVFSVTVLGETLTYAVDDIKIVKPEEADEIQIIPGQDHVTLLTCTPYAVNTHRLLVRGVRIDTPQELIVLSDAMQIDPVIVAPMVAAPILFILLLILLFGGRHKTRIRPSGNKKTGDAE